VPPNPNTRPRPGNGRPSPGPNGRGGPAVVPFPEDRLPPQNVPVEQALLGTLLLYGESLPAAAAALSGPADFYRASHELVYRAALDVAARGATPDFPTVYDQLQRAGDLDRAGGLDGLTELRERATIAENVPEYAAIVRDLARKRALIELADRMLRDGYDPGRGAEEILGAASERLARIAGAEGGGVGRGAEFDGGEVATLADVERELGETTYAWEGWVPTGAVTSLFAPPGMGKTRTVVSWCHPWFFGGAMPDGSPSGVEPGSPTLWVCYDRNWRGLIRAARQVDLPIDKATILPTHRGRPLWIPDFDDGRTMGLLERLIRRHRPAAVVIDTFTYATAFNTAKANETKLALDPLMGVMAETRTACLALTHTNKDGESLNRRLRERCRVEIKLSAPDEALPNRLRLEVDKTDDRKPPPLGITMGDVVAYDYAPPSAPSGLGRRGPEPRKTTGAAEWLWSYLQPGPAPVVEIVNAAREAGLLKSPTAGCPRPSLTTLYDARKRIARLHPGHDVDEFEATTRKGKPLKHWTIVKPADAAAEGGSDVSDAAF
jgi:hypothetical protein